MTTFEKSFIGKGTKVANLDIVRVTISKEKLEELLKTDLVQYDDREFLVFEVAGLKEKDQYGRTHTAYISKRIEDAGTGSSPKPRASKKNK
jgi:hypothetical protein